jgi:hypothetical protein
VSDVADFMRDHARNLVGIRSFGDQSLEYINLASRQGQGIGFGPPHNIGAQGHR